MPKGVEHSAALDARRGPPRVCGAVMPKGVEHAEPNAAEEYRRVCGAVMPKGVEHSMADVTLTNAVVQVCGAVMPKGVEHSARRRARTSSGGMWSRDAERR